jgi:hypothetical protein
MAPIDPKENLAAFAKNYFSCGGKAETT